MTWRRRTGIKTIKFLLHKVCLLIVKYRDYLQTILTEAQMVYVNALEQACNDFIINVPSEEPDVLV